MLQLNFKKVNAMDYLIFNNVIKMNSKQLMEALKRIIFYIKYIEYR